MTMICIVYTPHHGIPSIAYVSYSISSIVNWYVQHVYMLTTTYIHTQLACPLTISLSASRDIITYVCRDLCMTGLTFLAQN